MRSLTSAGEVSPTAGMRDPTHISFLFPGDCVGAAAMEGQTNACEDASARTDRFRRDIEALSLAPSPDSPLGVAVSGGADSLALVLLAHAAFPGAIAVATVDHGLRVESAEEARFVAAICSEIGVAHFILPIAMAPGGSVQARARQSRYDALGRWARDHGLTALATAHHRDDQAETLLMRVARGAGLTGLAAIRATTRMDREGAADVAIVRPLLGWSGAELRDVVRGSGLTPVLDPANDSLLFDRTRARRLLAATPWLRADRLAATVANLAEAEDALDWAARELLQHRIARQADGSLALAAAGLPAELQRRLLAKALRMLGGGADHPGPKLARLLTALRGGGIGTIGGVKASGGAVWRLCAAPPRQGN